MKHLFKINPSFIYEIHSFNLWEMDLKLLIPELCTPKMGIVLCLQHTQIPFLQTDFFYSSFTS